MKKIIKQFFAKKASKEDIQKVFDWFFDDQAGQRVFDDLNDDAFEKPDKTWEGKQNFQRIRRTINEPPARNTKEQRSMDISFWAKVAASVVILIGAAMAFHQMTAHFEKPEIARVEQVTKATVAGQKLTVFLPDGSKVMLHASTSITYNKTFDQDSTRSIQMSGEAFFDVAHNPDKPFIVEANGVFTKALGTSFNVFAREKIPTKIALVTGKVEVAHQENTPLVLNSGEQAVASTKGKILKKTFDIEEVIAWKNGTLIFSETPFPEAVGQLELWYGVTIDIKNQPGVTSGYSGVYTNKSLEEVLEGMAFVYDFDFEINEKDAVIIFN